MNIRSLLSILLWSNSWCYLKLCFFLLLYISTPSFFLSMFIPLAPYCFNHKGAEGRSGWALAVLLSHCPSSYQHTAVSAKARAKEHNPFRQPPPKSEGMKHMLPQINHCDQSHGCTANQWSERLWKSSSVPDVPSNDYVVSGAKGKLQTSRKLEQRACQFSTLIKHTETD